MNIESALSARFNAATATPSQTLQSLWSGYGSIKRYTFTNAQGEPCTPDSVIVKAIEPPQQTQHPRGWNTERSHQRKLHSYEVERHWYQYWAHLCPAACRVPICFEVFSDPAPATYLVLEDLDASGFDRRADTLTGEQATLCLRWLANFHATFMTTDSIRQSASHRHDGWPEGLWPTGTYWHLATRPDEYRAMADSPLKANAQRIDERLSACQYKTLVHGDAKVANFCFNRAMTEVAAVDFQYVGGGCGIKDVVYFLGSCLTDSDCAAHCDALLDDYFDTLQRALISHPQAHAINPAELEREWRQLFPMAWADFNRFLAGWSPTHRKLNDFSQRLSQQALEDLS